MRNLSPWRFPPRICSIFEVFCHIGSNFLAPLRGPELFSAHQILHLCRGPYNAEAIFRISHLASPSQRISKNIENFSTFWSFFFIFYEISTLFSRMLENQASREKSKGGVRCLILTNIPNNKKVWLKNIFLTLYGPKYCFQFFIDFWPLFSSLGVSKTLFYAQVLDRNKNTINLCAYEISSHNLIFRLTKLNFMAKILLYEFFNFE